MRLKNGTKHAVRAGLVAAALCGVSLSGNAAYQQMTPPPGVSTGTGSDFARLMMKPVAPSTWQQNLVRANAGVNVGGRVVQVPVTMRLAATAPMVMARAAFSHPALLAGAIAAPYLIEWANSKDFSLGDDPDNPGTKRWEIETKNYGRYWMIESLGVTEWHVTPGAACGAAVARFKANTPNDAYGTHTFEEHVTFAGAEPQGCSVKRTTWAVQENRYYYTDYYGSFQTKPTAETARRPATLAEFEQDLGTTTMPPQVPAELPVPLPVDPPIFNPAPTGVPTSRPLTIPLGEPTRIPDTDPPQWKQPVADVIPSPTPNDPWRIDVREREVSGSTPDGLPDPEKNDAPEAKPEEKPDFCEANPESIACAEMDTPDGEIPRSEREVTYSAEDSGVAGSGSCPANKTLTLSNGQTITAYDWQPACVNITTYVRPVVLAAAAFIALLILVPAVRSDL